MSSKQSLKLRHSLHSRRPVARSFDRRGDAADLRHVDLCAVEPRRAQGLRLRAHRQSDTRRVGAVHRQSRERHARLRVRFGHGGDQHAARADRLRQSHRRDERSVRRHVPRVRARAPPLGESRHQLRRSHAAGESGEGRAAADAHDLDRNADQSDAAPRGHRADGGVRAQARHPHGRRQYVRESVDSAAAGARRRHRHALGDEVPQRSLRHGRRRRRHCECGARREDRVPAERSRRDRRPVRQLPRIARLENARAAHAAGERERPAHRGMAGEASARGAGVLSRTAEPSAARACEAADEERLQRHRHVLRQGWYGGSAARAGALPRCSRWPRVSAASRAWSITRA